MEACTYDTPRVLYDAFGGVGDSNKNQTKALGPMKIGAGSGGDWVKDERHRSMKS
jgi:hypothetical protein